MTQSLFHDDAYACTCEATVVRCEAGIVVLDRTVFYATGGGQPGDTGQLAAGDLTVPVIGTIKGEGDEIVHQVEGMPPLAAGQAVVATLDWPRRHRLMRFHTALHLLCAVVDAPVTGGRMAEDKAHLDFDIDMALLDGEAIERRLNELVLADLPVAVGAIRDEELDANPGLVKTMSVQPPRGQGSVRTIRIADVDYQPCGGTHLARTGEVGPVRVARIRSEGRRNKRVTLVFAEDPA
ncbi:MAG: alanyl-tRNA editing protein [Rhodocyclaceae bacterium]|nr:alanyl-tRNA editing protein [Rhodocyclaceae bacterium]